MVVAASFVWGYQTHRALWFPYTITSWFFSDVVAQPYSWVRPTRPAANLRALAYVGSSFDANADRVGVQTHDANRAWQGLNFYYSEFTPPFLLMDMEGREVWRWDYEPGALLAHAELLPNGDLIVVRFDDEVVRLDRDAQLLWRASVRAHHDVAIVGDELYVLSRQEGLDPSVHPTQLTLEDSVTVLDVRDGRILREFSLLDSVQRSPYRFLLPSVSDRTYLPEDGPLDITHTNHVEVFDGELAHLDSIYAAGNMLVSMRHLNAVLILEAETHDVIWVWGPSNTYAQHHPRLLPSGRLLLFDNGISRSRVLEMDPLSGRVEWTYTDDALFSALRGGVQRLPNGNTLITESDTGYVFEVTRAGDVVWEFANPDVNGAGDRSVIWRMSRHAVADLPFLAR